MGRMLIPSNFDWPFCPLSFDENRSFDCICGNRRTLLLPAEDGLMLNILIFDNECGATNLTDSYLASVGD